MAGIATKEAYCYMLLKDKFYPQGSLLTLENKDMGKYRALSSSNSPAALCSQKEVVAVTYSQYELLEAIEPPSARYSVYFTPGKLAWGLKLSVGDPVQVLLPDLQQRRGSNTSGQLQLKKSYVAAVVRWKGTVSEPYTDVHRFGVEIMVLDSPHIT